MSKMSEWQRQMLAVFEAEPDRWFRPAEIADQMGTHVEGASITVASLVKRGKVERDKRGGRVFWRLAR